MTISAQNDALNLGSTKELSHYTKAVSGGVLHIVASRANNHHEVAAAFQASGSIPAAQFTTINVTTGTLAANAASGAAYTSLMSTNATPGNQAMRTPAQIAGDLGVSAPFTWVLEITNTGAGTLTLTTDSGSGFTMTGTMTVPQNTTRRFSVKLNTATTGTVQAVGVGTYS